MSNDAEPQPSTAMTDSPFLADRQLLARAVDQVTAPAGTLTVADLPQQIPAAGLGPQAALDLIAQVCLPVQGALNDPLAAGRMASPTPWVTWAAGAWAAARSENLLHQGVTPQAADLQQLVMRWLLPLWGMSTGHMVPGATLANLTAVWAARDSAGAARIVASEAANDSVAKVARVLAMPLTMLPVDSNEGLNVEAFVDFCRREPDSMSRSVVVLTAGTHNCGAVDPIRDCRRALASLGITPAWWHVDAAWAGPLALSERHSSVLKGIESADSVSVAPYKFMFQPTDAAIVSFRDRERVEEVLEFGGPDGTSQIGLLGSRADRALSLAVTFLAYGTEGVGAWIDQGIASMMSAAEALRARPDVEVFGPPRTGILLWRPLNRNVNDVLAELGPMTASLGLVDGRRWVRHLGTNPALDWHALVAQIDTVLAH